MMRAISTLLLCWLAGLVTCCSTNPKPTVTAQVSRSSMGDTLWVTANGLRLKTKVYKSRELSSHPVLILVLHGDLLEAGVSPTYHYEFGRKAAEVLDDAIVVAILRPGYVDDVLDHSAGRQGM